MKAHSFCRKWNMRWRWDGIEMYDVVSVMHETVFTKGKAGKGISMQLTQADLLSNKWRLVWDRCLHHLKNFSVQTEPLPQFSPWRSLSASDITMVRVTRPNRYTHSSSDFSVQMESGAVCSEVSVLWGGFNMWWKDFYIANAIEYMFSLSQYNLRKSSLIFQVMVNHVTALQVPWSLHLFLLV